MKGIKLRLNGIPTKNPNRTVSGKLWPCNEFSYGHVPARPDERLDERPIEVTMPGDEGTAAAAPLDLRNLPNSNNPQCLLSAGDSGQKERRRPESYGRKGITSYGKKMVKSAGALIDKVYPRHRVTFATVTLPSMPSDMRRDVAGGWAAFVRELIQWLRRRMVRHGLPEVVVSVTEVQPGRLAETGEGYLHLHLLWLNQPGRSGNWAVDVEEMKSWVRSFWERKELWPVEGHVNVDVRRVKGEKARYLAKYVSKGTAEIEAVASDIGWPSVPSQWWNMSNRCRDWVKAHTLEGSVIGGLLKELVEGIFEYDDFSPVRYLYHIDVNMGGALVNVGWRGAVWDDWQKYLRELAGAPPDFRVV